MKHERHISSMKFSTPNILQNAFWQRKGYILGEASGHATQPMLTTRNITKRAVTNDYLEVGNYYNGAIDIQNYSNLTNIKETMKQ